MRYPKIRCRSSSRLNIMEWNGSFECLIMKSIGWLGASSCSLHHRACSTITTQMLLSWMRTVLYHINDNCALILLLINEINCLDVMFVHNLHEHCVKCVKNASCQSQHENLISFCEHRRGGDMVAARMTKQTATVCVPFIIYVSSSRTHHLCALRPFASQHAELV